MVYAQQMKEVGDHDLEDSLCLADSLQRVGAVLVGDEFAVELPERDLADDEVAVEWRAAQRIAVEREDLQLRQNCQFASHFFDVF